MDWKEKLERELEESYEKTDRLNDAICDAVTGKRNDIASGQLLLMKCQLEAMNAVERILEFRIKEANGEIK